MEVWAADQVGFRDRQRTGWNRVAQGWSKWSGLLDAAASGISERLVDLAGVDRGSRVLDIAAGYAEPSLTAARKAGPDGLVVAVDISAQMLAFGRQRAEAAGVSNIQFVEREASALQFPEKSFDAALSRWGIIFEPDAEGVARRVRRFLKPAGRFAISSWGPSERVPFLAIPMKIVMGRLAVPPPPRGTPGPLSRPTPEAIGGLLEAAGFSQVAVEEAAVTYEFESTDEFVSFTRDVAFPVIELLAPHPQEVQDEIWAAIAQAIDDVAGGSRPVVLHNLVLLASGAAPARR
jgi:SAM-dependent methyltransferase